MLRRHLYRCVLREKLRTVEYGSATAEYKSDVVCIILRIRFVAAVIIVEKRSFSDFFNSAARRETFKRGHKGKSSFSDYRHAVAKLYRFEQTVGKCADCNLRNACRHGKGLLLSALRVSNQQSFSFVVKHALLDGKKLAFSAQSVSLYGTAFKSVSSHSPDGRGKSDAFKLGAIRKHTLVNVFKRGIAEINRFQRLAAAEHAAFARRLQTAHKTVRRSVRRVAGRISQRSGKNDFFERKTRRKTAVRQLGYVGRQGYFD